MKRMIFLFALTVTPLMATEPFEEGLERASYYETSQGHLLRYTCFKSPGEGSKKTIFFLQGRGTFLEFYRALIEPLLARDCDVWMYDLSGQGGSTRLLDVEEHDAITQQHMQHIETFDLYIEDAMAFMRDVVLPQTEGELILGGYSTGGHVALRLLQRYPDTPFKAAFVISPLLALNIPLPNKPLSYLFWGFSFVIDMKKYAPGVGHEDAIFITPFEGNGYTSHKESYYKMQDLCIQHKPYVMGGASLGWVQAALDSVDALWQEEAICNIRIPVLMATGGGDTIVDISNNALFSQLLEKVTHLFYPKGRHELFREAPEIRAQWWAEFDYFFRHEHFREAPDTRAQWWIDFNRFFTY